jgi:HEAT repeat protein
MIVESEVTRASRMGSRRAVPALERVAKDDSFKGILNVRGMAKDALERIAKREKRCGARVDRGALN